MTSFIGRTAELQKLSEFFKSDTENAALVCGRRRVGKSELLKESLRRADCRSIYYECKQTFEANNTRSLGKIVSAALGLPPLAFGSLEELLGFLFKRSESEPLILVLDEWPFLKDVIPGADSILKSLLDQNRDTSKLKIVLCDSFSDAMEQTLAAESPLLGRFGLVLSLKPMDYLESSLFYPSFSNEDKVRLYSVFGGIPYYSRLISEQLSVKENLLELIVSEGARLENDIPMLLQLGPSRITVANEVLEALSRGFTRFSDLLSQSGSPNPATLTAVLGKLVQLGIVSKEAPINEEGNRKKTGYFISDGLALFYYTYVFRHLSERAVLNPSDFYETCIARDFETEFVPRRFERLCAEFLIRQNRAGKITPPFGRIGKYRCDLPKEKRSGEFDVVTQDSRGYAFYEAKFRKAPVTLSMIRKEIAEVTATGLSVCKCGFFSRSGFEEDVLAFAEKEPLTLCGLDDLYAEAEDLQKAAVS